MKSFCSCLFRVWVVFLIIGSRFVLACPDPCPNVSRGNSFRDSGMAFWDQKYLEVPERKGVSSYHINESQGLANYIAFLGNTDTVLVGEANCELTNPIWQFLQWQNVTPEEFEQFKFVESYYQGNDVKALKKANYLGNKTIYLLTTELKGEAILIFVLFNSNGHELTRAFAWSINSAPRP